MIILLIGAGVLCIALLIILVVMLTKSQRATKSAAPEPAKTRAFQSLRAEFLIEKGPDKGITYTLRKQVTTIGRGGSRKNDVELSDDTVSKEQSSIVYDRTTKEFSVSNESTTNPTQVNQEIVTDPVILKNNDLIEVGASAIRFKRE